MSADTATAKSKAEPRRWVMLGVLASAQFLVTLDSSIVNVALPSMQRDLGLSESGLAWVVNSYVLAFGGFLLLFGRVADLVGRRRVFAAGAVVFTVASIVAGLSGSQEVLLAARAVQGLGAAALSPAALSIVLTTFSGQERGKALGIWGAVAAGGGSAGVLLGGIITETLGWQWVFYLTVPISAAAAMLAPAVLRRDPGLGLGAGFDALGALTITGGITSAVLAVLQGAEAGWGSPSTWLFIILAAALVIAFVFVERRAFEPLIPLQIFSSRSFSGGSAIALFGGAAIMSMWFLLSLFMQQVVRYDATTTGLAYLPMTFMIFLVSVLAVARVVNRLGARTVLIVGLVLLAGALVWLSQAPVGAVFSTNLLPPMLIGAVGLSFVFMPSTMVAVSGAKSSQSGLASGMVNMAFQVGGALGVALVAGISSQRAAAAVATGSAGPEALAQGLSAGLMAGASVAAAALIIALTVLKPRRRD